MNAEYMAALFANGNIGHTVDDLTIPTTSFINFGRLKDHALRKEIYRNAPASSKGKRYTILIDSHYQFYQFFSHL
jgi:hypothetical protein